MVNVYPLAVTRALVHSGARMTALAPLWTHCVEMSCEQTGCMDCQPPAMPEMASHISHLSWSRSLGFGFCRGNTNKLASGSGVAALLIIVRVRKAGGKTSQMISRDAEVIMSNIKQCAALTDIIMLIVW